jgi:hypothetical protein
MRNAGEPSEVNKHLPMVAREATSELSISTNKDRYSCDDLKIAHIQNALIA